MCDHMGSCAAPQCAPYCLHHDSDTSPRESDMLPARVFDELLAVPEADEAAKLRLISARHVEAHTPRRTKEAQWVARPQEGSKMEQLRIKSRAWALVKPLPGPVEGPAQLLCSKNQLSEFGRCYGSR
ncbi:unnamed protein product [Effrenium voratum]|uniref:Uncharacterized protein n=1 Tax=Effrenium voratum TaxID=2562239 RepID=A0AA36HTJ8_9DINO|nr:unnamed protein product [Effrenium voratum]